MYCEFYQLTERPFNVTPDPKFLYLNARYRTNDQCGNICWKDLVSITDILHNRCRIRIDIQS